MPPNPSYDVLIVGAGMSGLCSLHQIRQRLPEWRVKVIDSAADVGGTWFWNRYPGCRVDSESVSYGFSFDKELLEEWHWKETFSSQPELLRYLRRFAEKHDLLKDIAFDTTIKSARWDDSFWTLVDDSGREYTSTFLISCVGFLSTPTLPAIPGIETFDGQAFHTSRWPADLEPGRDFAGKRIGVIGTGATGIQTITTLSKEPLIKSLTVFQRTANWGVPIRNSEITSQQMAEYRKQYGAIFQQCNSTFSGFIHAPDFRKSTDVSDEERLALWEKLYSEPGMGKWLSVFIDTYVDGHANDLYSKFMANKIRERVHNPTVRESLVPKDHGFGTRRVPLESGYYESFNNPHVSLVDLRKTPIERITKRGITTSACTHDLDVLIYATGFDAITGAFGAIDWHGRDGRPLMGGSGTGAVWVDHNPNTLMGITAPAMPNMFMVLGPHQAFGNAPRTIENAVDVVCGLLQFCKDNNYRYVEPKQEAADEWTDHVIMAGGGTLGSSVDNWMTGVNSNVPGKTSRSVMMYLGGCVEYRRRCEDWKSSGYNGLVFQ